MATEIKIADGISYKTSGAERGPPTGFLFAKGDAWAMRPFIQPFIQDGHEFLGSAECIGNTERVMNISKRVWLLMMQADRDEASVKIDVSAQHDADEAARKQRVAEDAARTARPRTLTEQQKLEKAYDDVQNESAYGYNPHRVGDRPTYWPTEDRREHHFPEGA